MKTRNRRYIFLAMISSLVTVLIWTGLLGVSRVQAQPWQAQPPPPNDEDLQFIAFFTDELTIQISDLGGNIVGEGTHLGRVLCPGSNCSQKTSLDFSLNFAIPTQIDYKFKELLALDPEAERAVVAGVGAIKSDHMNEKFSFSAVLQNNGDGTISVTYVASRPDASVALRSPGSFVISRR